MNNASSEKSVHEPASRNERRRIKYAFLQYKKNYFFVNVQNLVTFRGPGMFQRDPL